MLCSLRFPLPRTLTQRPPTPPSPPLRPFPSFVGWAYCPSGHSGEIFLFGVTAGQGALHFLWAPFFFSPT